MPYITQDRRRILDNRLREVSDVVESVGEANYTITKLLLGVLPKEPSYTDFNAVIGVLESAKLEFYRRQVAAYEDQKRAENGDVYPR
jgi:hypothetical protein